MSRHWDQRELDLKPGLVVKVSQWGFGEPYPVPSPVWGVRNAKGIWDPPLKELKSSWIEVMIQEGFMEEGTIHQGLLPHRYSPLLSAIAPWSLKDPRQCSQEASSALSSVHIWGHLNCQLLPEQVRKMKCVPFPSTLSLTTSLVSGFHPGVSWLWIFQPISVTPLRSASHVWEESFLALEMGTAIKTPCFYKPPFPYK